MPEKDPVDKSWSKRLSSIGAELVADRNPIDLYKNLLVLWRIVVCVISCQIIGPRIGAAISSRYDSLIYLWMGPEVVSFIGFLIGVWWHLAKTRDVEKRAIPTAVIIGFLLFLMGAYAVIFEIPHRADCIRRLGELKSVQLSTIKKVSIYKSHGGKPIRELTDRKSIFQFMYACRDLSAVKTSFYRESTSWRIVLHGEKTIAFTFGIRTGRASILIGYFRDWYDPFYEPRGSFSSYKLKTWFETFRKKEKF